jgi:prepilin peptidase CpaA
MNLLALAPTWGLAGLALLLVAAACQDAAQLRIANLLSAGVLLLGVAMVISVGVRVDLWQNFALLVAALTVGTLLHSAGKMGGGDVKLFAATAFWLDPGGALWLVVLVTMCGGLLAIIIITLRLFQWGEAAQRRVIILQRRSGIPYGVAIAAGALLTIALLPNGQSAFSPTDMRNLERR